MPPVKDYKPHEYQDYVTEFPGVLEEISWSWWDTGTIVTATATALSLFTGAVPASLDLGNMLLDSVLPAPDAFLVENIRAFMRVRPEGTTAAASGAVQAGPLDDLVQVIQTTVATLTIGQKTYGQWPLWQLPAGGGALGLQTTGDIDLVFQGGNNGVPDGRAPYALATPLLIMPQINFNVTLDLAAAITLVNSALVTIVLDGRLLRAVQ